MPQASKAVTSTAKPIGVTHPVVQPDAATRAEELKAREEAMAKDLKRLKQRLTKTPSKSVQQAVHKEWQHILDHHGYSEKLGQAFNLSSLEMALQNQDAMPQNFLEALVQFNQDMKARGIDLIVLPPTPKASFLIHQAVDGADAHSELWPGWTQMMIQLLENDIEIIEVADAWRQEAGNKMPVVWLNDGHTGPTGRKIFAQALAERLQRYEFTRKLQEKPALYTYSEPNKPAPK